MLNKEQYEYIVKFKPICEMMVKHETYIGGADELFNYLEQQGLTGGEHILRGCATCTTGFLKWTYSMINLYEKNNNNNSTI